MNRDVAASVRGRLMNQARETGRPFQELLQYFAMERFLFRLSKSEHADRFVLKGALMFAVWGTAQSRATRDIDLLARADNSVEAMTGMVKDICDQAVAPDGVNFVTDTVEGVAIKEDAEYSGVRVTFVAMIQNARLPMQIDIGFGDVVHPSALDVVFPAMLDFESARLTGYSKETVIAEKFEAMIKLGQLNSRMKDFFDILTLCRHFDFDGGNLTIAIKKTFSNRGTAVEAKPFVFSNDFFEDAQKQVQWTAFLRKSKLDRVPSSFAEVARELSVFLSPIAKAIELESPFDSQWAAGGPWNVG